MLRKSGEPARPLTEWAFSYSRPEPLAHSEAWTLQHERDLYRDEYQALLKRRGVDFILSPANPAVAAVMGESHYWNYTAIWNMTDMPAAVFPSGLTVDPDLDALTKQDKKYVPRNEVDEREWNKYQSPERYEGAPIALQIAGRHFKDEETLAAAKLVEEIIKGGVKGSKL
jgi:Asp-tRNA(Asn)/Glu-tRNA(Gln) amidotransferase A subunit family amidase